MLNTSSHFVLSIIGIITLSFIVICENPLSTAYLRFFFIQDSEVLYPKDITVVSFRYIFHWQLPLSATINPIYCTCCSTFLGLTYATETVLQSPSVQLLNTVAVRGFTALTPSSLLVKLPGLTFLGKTFALETTLLSTSVYPLGTFSFGGSSVLILSSINEYTQGYPCYCLLCSSPTFSSLPCNRSYNRPSSLILYLVHSKDHIS